MSAALVSNPTVSRQPAQLTRAHLTQHPRLIQGLRPWVAAPCSLVLCALADRLRCHHAMLLLCFAAATALRGALAVAPGGVAGVSALLLLAEMVGSPVGVIVDAAVVAKCQQDGSYGKQRVWASIGWGGLSTAAGALITHTSVRAGILAFVAMSCLALPAAWLLAPGAEAAGDEIRRAAAAGRDDGRGAAAPTGGAAASGQQQEQHAARAAAAPAVSHHARHARAESEGGDLNTRLLSVTPPRSGSSTPASSPCKASSAGGTIPLTLPALLLRARCGADAAKSGGGAEVCSCGGTASDGSCCTTPRSTAALLGGHEERSLPPSPLPVSNLSPRAASAGKELFTDLVRIEPCAPPPGAAGESDHHLQTEADVGKHQGAAGGLAECETPVDGHSPLVVVQLHRRAGEKDDKQAAAADAKAAAAAPVGEQQQAADERKGFGGPTPAADESIGVAGLLFQPGVATFMLRALVIGFGLGAQGAFASLLVVQLGGNELLVSLMLVVSMMMVVGRVATEDSPCADDSCYSLQHSRQHVPNLIPSTLMEKPHPAVFHRDRGPRVPVPVGAALPRPRHPRDARQHAAAGAAAGLLRAAAARALGLGGAADRAAARWVDRSCRRDPSACWFVGLLRRCHHQQHSLRPWRLTLTLLFFPETSRRHVCDLLGRRHR
jgi:hypothetical protein